MKNENHRYAEAQTYEKVKIRIDISLSERQNFVSERQMLKIFRLAGKRIKIHHSMYLFWFILKKSPPVRAAKMFDVFNRYAETLKINTDRVIPLWLNSHWPILLKLS